MLLTIQFPIADSRQFLAEETGFLNIPAWGYSVDPDRDFVRSFGKIEKRRLGGLKSWIGEGSICFAKKALRFPDQNSLNYFGSQTPIPLRVVFRRFFSDGIATGKFEVGIGTRCKNSIQLSLAQTKEFINHCLEMEVQVTHWNERVSLADAGKCIASLYLKASSKIKKLKTLKPQNWWVEAGKPILFFVYSESEKINIPFHITGIKKIDPETNPYDLAFCKVPRKNGIEIGMWLVKFKGDIDYKSVRELRIALLRLHAERQCVRSILRNIGKGKIIIDRKVKVRSLQPNEADTFLYIKENASDIFQQYWKTVVGRIGSYKRIANNMIDALPEEDEISVAARQAEDLIEPGERQEILNGLERIRPNYLKTIEKFIYNDNKYYGDIKEQIMTKNEENKTVEQELNIGDNATIGAIAKNHAEMHGNIVQDNSGSDIDLKVLVAELAKLRLELDKRKSTLDDSIEIGKIAQAESEAGKGNASKVWEILKTSGKWVLDTATEIGAKVAVEAIKKSIGL